MSLVHPIAYDKITVGFLMLTAFAIITQIALSPQQVKLPLGVILLLTVGCLIALRLNSWMPLLAVILAVFIFIGYLRFPDNLNKLTHPSSGAVFGAAIVQLLSLIGAAASGILALMHR
jgi:hypothetical protein